MNPATPPDPALPADQRRAIVRDSLGVALATSSYGVSFGAISVSSGLDVWQTCALSLLVFTGASQFAFVGAVAAGGTPMSGAMAAVLLGSRNALYGFRLAPLLGWHGVRRFALAHLVIDESTAMAVLRPSRRAARLGFLATGVGVFVLWNLATLIGALAGNLIGDPRTYGLDAAVGAAFLALLWPRLRGRHNQRVAAASAAGAGLLIPFTAAGVPILAAGGVALLFSLLGVRGEP
jgi:predicted branched-subunit amino acid permease